jgi:hypothetical protein
LQRLGTVRLERFPLLRLQLRSTRQQRVERAEPADQFDRALLADAGHAGDVVARVTDERQHVDDSRRHDAELLEDTLVVEPRAVLARVVDAHVIADELKEVLVDGNDHDLEAGRGRPPRHRTDDVVGLIAGRGEDRYSHRLARLVHPVDLLPQIVGHRRSIRLVVGRDVVAKGGPGQIERCRQVCGGMILDELSQHRDEHVHRVCRVAVLIRETAPAKRVIGAVHLRTAVDEKQGGTGHCGGRLLQGYHSDSCHREDAGPSLRCCWPRSRRRPAADSSPRSTSTRRS